MQRIWICFFLVFLNVVLHDLFTFLKFSGSFVRFHRFASFLGNYCGCWLKKGKALRLAFVILCIWTGKCWPFGVLFFLVSTRTGLSVVNQAGLRILRFEDSFKVACVFTKDPRMFRLTLSLSNLASIIKGV